MLTETPVRNPIITEYETNLVERPRRRIPAATRTMPARITSSDTACGRWSAGTFCSAEPAARAAADVVVITIIRVLELSPPTMGPAKPAYRPCTGLTPARTAAAIPSGTLLIAPGRPATRSARRLARSGRTERSHRPTGATGKRLTSIPRSLQQHHAGDAGRIIPDDQRRGTLTASSTGDEAALPDAGKGEGDWSRAAEHL